MYDRLGFARSIASCSGVSCGTALRNSFPSSKKDPDTDENADQQKLQFCSPHAPLHHQQTLITFDCVGTGVCSKAKRVNGVYLRDVVDLAQPFIQTFSHLSKCAQQKISTLHARDISGRGSKPGISVERTRLINSMA